MKILHEKFSAFLFFLLFSIPCFADSAQDLYTFPTIQQQTQFMHLAQTLRCLVCQNETLADSNAPLAQDLRNTIAQQVLQKKTDPEIIAYLVNRYGDFILYQPRLSANTMILWFAPLLLLVLGAIVFIIIILQRQRRARTSL